MIPRIEAWKIGRTGEISNAMNSFGEVVPRGGLSGDASEASKINNLTSPQHSRLYQENVLCRFANDGDVKSELYGPAFANPKMAENPHGIPLKDAEYSICCGYSAVYRLAPSSSITPGAIHRARSA
jgi:hypothetical protein